MAPRIGKPRDPAKERFWRRTMAQHARSGLSIAAFCRRAHLTTGTFRWWRQELARRDRGATTARADRAPSPSTELVVRSAFLPVRVVPDDPEPSQGTAFVEILLPAGPTVRVARGFDPADPRGGPRRAGGPPMLSLPPSVRILLAREPADMRKGFDGLAYLVRSVLAEDPFSGHLFVFRNRRGDRIKVLFWDADGFSIFYKRLEKGTFRFPAPSQSEATGVPVKAADLLMLLEGVDLGSLRRQRRYERQPA